jgi:superfamily I DNA and/or RNA helicase
LEVECDTIYRFQGREKDVIIISFCKSSRSFLNSFQKKFLSQKNQLNVSITRSRKKLIVIADTSLLDSSYNMKELFDSISLFDTIYLEDLFF